MAITDPEIIAREELYPRDTYGWTWPGEWHSEAYHQKLLAEAETIAEERKNGEATEVEAEKPTPGPDSKRRTPRNKDAEAGRINDGVE